MATEAHMALDLRDLRVASALMLAAALVAPILPAGHRGVTCPLRTLTGIPCPLCGMTTSVVATVHLDLGAGWRANPAGLLAVAVAIALVVFPKVRRVAVPGWVVPAGLAVMWLWELVRFGVL